MLATGPRRPRARRQRCLARTQPRGDRPAGLDARPAAGRGAGHCRAEEAPLPAAARRCPPHPRRPTPALADIGDLAMEKRTGRGLPPSRRTAPSPPADQQPPCPPTTRRTPENPTTAPGFRHVRAPKLRGSPGSCPSATPHRPNRNGEANRAVYGPGRASSQQATPTRATVPAPHGYGRMRLAAGRAGVHYAIRPQLHRLKGRYRRSLADTSSAAAPGA
jgi:hypothetical protein